MGRHHSAKTFLLKRNWTLVSSVDADDRHKLGAWELSAVRWHSIQVFGFINSLCLTGTRDKTSLDRFPRTADTETKNVYRHTNLPVDFDHNFLDNNISIGVYDCEVPGCHTPYNEDVLSKNAYQKKKPNEENSVD